MGPQLARHCPPATAGLDRLLPGEKRRPAARAAVLRPQPEHRAPGAAGSRYVRSHPAADLPQLCPTNRAAEHACRSPPGSITCPASPGPRPVKFDLVRDTLAARSISSVTARASADPAVSRTSIPRCHCRAASAAVHSPSPPAGAPADHPPDCTSGASAHRWPHSSSRGPAASATRSSHRRPGNLA